MDLLPVEGFEACAQSRNLCSADSEGNFNGAIPKYDILLFAILGASYVEDYNISGDFLRLQIVFS